MTCVHPYLSYLSFLPIFLYLTSSFLFFFNDTATTEIYTLSLHDALPISPEPSQVRRCRRRARTRSSDLRPRPRDRKSTRLNSSHVAISYAVFCLKKKKKTHKTNRQQIYNLSTQQPEHAKNHSALTILLSC